MAYYFSKTLPVGFDEAVRRTTEALKQQDFGIIRSTSKKPSRKSSGSTFVTIAILGLVIPHFPMKR